jgi:hypothetical protein
MFIFATQINQVMKRTVIILFAALAFSFVVNAQPRAIGIRGGYGAEVSYQHTLNKNFIEGDLGINPSGLWVTGIYNFIYPLEAEGFNLYFGPGVEFGGYRYYMYDKSFQVVNTYSFDFGIAGQIGVEYNLPKVPIQLSIDWRPAFSFLHPNFNYLGLGLAARYRF